MSYLSTSLNTGQPARDIGYGVVQAITRTVAYNSLGIDTADTVKLGTLPSGAQVLQCIVRVTTAFNAATTNVLTVGTSSGSDADIVSASDVNEGAAGTTIVATSAGLAFSADTPIYVKYTQTGTAATAGAAVITLTYVATSNG
jgi:hypothetical protein